MFVFVSDIVSGVAKVFFQGSPWNYLKIIMERESATGQVILEGWLMLPKFYLYYCTAHLRAA